MKHIGKLAVLGAVFAAAAPFASATPLTPGTLNQAPTTVLASSYNTGSVVGSASGTISPGTFTASWTETVYRGGTGATCASCLTFVYTFSSSASSADIIAHSSEASFLGFTVDADYVAGTGTAPLFVSESGSGVVDWNVNIAAGSTSATLVVFTNAVNTKAGTFTLSDGTTGFQTDLAPNAAPEPNSLMLLGTGLLGTAGMIVRRRRAV